MPLFNSGKSSSSSGKQHAPSVVITGASSGIGRATALAYAKEGAHLVLAARGRAGLEEVATECQAAGAEVLVVPTDVANTDAVRALAHAAITRFDGIDVWINIAGVGAVGPYDLTPMDAHRRVIEVNLMGHMNGAHAVMPHFRARKRGTLINMISVGGWAVAPYAASYTASKFGLRGFSESLRAELGNMPGVQVCEVYPGFADTPGMVHGANYSGKYVKPPPLLLDPRRVADAVLSLGKNPRPVTWVGGVALPARMAHALAPQLTGRMSVRLTDLALKRARAAPSSDGNLYTPSQGHAIDGGYRMRSSRMLPMAALALIGTVGLAMMLAGRARRLR